MTRNPAVGPLSRPFRVDRLPKDRSGITIAATREEEAALAADFRIPAIRDLVAHLHWDGSPSRLVITGTVTATVTQICTISLEPFESEVSEPVEITFTDTDRLAGTDAEDEDVPDPIVGGRIDLGQVTAEFLALGLDPYPRKPGVAFEPVVEDSPLSALKALRPEE